MSDDIRQHSGSKYIRTIRDCIDPTKTVQVDVYSVLDAYGDPPTPIGHAVKKLLCSGIRCKGSRLQDLIEARDAISREIVKLEAEARDPKVAFAPVLEKAQVGGGSRGHVFEAMFDKGESACKYCGVTLSQYEKMSRPVCAATSEKAAEDIFPPRS